jgi:hypothetical protein
MTQGTPPPAGGRLVVTAQGLDVRRHPDQHGGGRGVSVADHGPPVSVHVQGHRGTGRAQESRVGAQREALAEAVPRVDGERPVNQQPVAVVAPVDDVIHLAVEVGQVLGRHGRKLRDVEVRVTAHQRVERPGDDPDVRDSAHAR